MWHKSRGARQGKGEYEVYSRKQMKMEFEYHCHRNESEARQYHFRINYPQNYESESERKFGAGVDEIHLEVAVMPKNIGINK